MRSVRCNACGTKALTAASKCPKCSHLFEVRDGFGELLPLAYCSSCDSYYPESVGSCRWCGTTPERAPIAPYVWKGVGAAALALVIGGAWLMRDTRPKHAEQARLAAQLKPDTVAIPADTAAPRTASTAIASGGNVDRDSARAPDPVSAVSIDTIVPKVAPPAVATPKPLDKPVDKPADKPVVTLPVSAPPTSPSSSRWVSSIAKHWVVVRADASKGSRIVASIGPDSRVQLGESRGSWRRIKARGVAGWVEPRSFFVAVRSPTKTGLAAR